METKRIIIPNRRLYADTMDEVFSLVESTFGSLVFTPSHYCVEIDCTKARFIDPYGITCLCLLARCAKQYYAQEVLLKLPANADVQTYLGRMNFPTMVAPYASLENDQFASLYDTDEESDVLLTITPIPNQQDIDNIIQFILEKVGSILEKKLGYEEKYAHSCLQVLSELCYNVNDHSQDEGYAAVQTYTQKDGRRFVIISVADLGIGIKESLSERYDVTGWSHSYAISQSLKKECTRFRDGRGLGLYMVQKIVQEYDGRLNIRSGDARLHLSQHPSTCRSGSFPGTQISLSLSEKRA